MQDLRFKQEIFAGIVGKRFDLLMLDRSYSGWIAPTAFVSKYHTHRDVLTLYMPHNNYRWQVDVWEPKK